MPPSARDSCTPYPQQVKGTISEVSLPVLKSIGGDLNLNGNNNILALAFPKLTTVGGYIGVRNNPNLQTFSFPELTSVGQASCCNHVMVCLPLTPTQGATHRAPRLPT